MAVTTILTKTKRILILRQTIQKIYMTFEEIYKNIKKQEYAPVYFLMGEESFYIDKITPAVDLVP